MVVSKSCFYNNRFSHPEADKTLTDARLIININAQALIIVLKSLGQPEKNDPAKKIIIGQKSGPAKTILGQKSGPAMAGPAVPPTTALALPPLTGGQSKMLFKS